MICYLCSRELILNEEINEDHVPQSGFFLTKNPPGIKKLKTHKECNSKFGLDEEYIISLIRATSTWNHTGERIWKKRGLKSFLEPGKKKFLKQVVSETRPGKEMLSNIPKHLENLPTTRMELARLIRVLDKIVRGLYFSEFSRTIESDGYNLDTDPDNFICKQELWGWKIEDPSFISVGSPGSEEFKFLRRFINQNLEYNLFFYNIHYFRLMYDKIC